MIVLVGSGKGGVGKTTIAVTIAAMSALAGKSVMLIDTDVQESASIWGSVRGDRGIQPQVITMIKKGKLGYDLLQLRDKFDVIVVDAGGRDSLELRQAIAVADKMLVPVRPSQFDTWAIGHMLTLFQEVQEKVDRLPETWFLLNAVSTNRQVKEADELRAALSEAGVDTLETQLADRISYRRSVTEGRCVAELSGNAADKNALAEVRSLYKEIFGEEFTPAAVVEPAAA